MDNQDSTSNDGINFPDQRQYMDTIAKASDSQPTKTKVAAFKTRVFKMIKLYTQMSNNLNPLLQSINQQIFTKSPQKINELVLLLLNKQPNMDIKYVNKLLQMYKIMLLFKAKPQINTKLTQTFVKILKRTIQDGGKQIVQQMIQKVFTKRSCKLNVTFFQFLARKIPMTKKIILNYCNALSSNKDKKLRPAQIKQIDKLKSKVSKQKIESVKKEQAHSQ